jgi:geranylgeranyl diphosphate synthase, type II
MFFNPERIVERINTEISTADFGSRPEELYEPVKYFMELGGKRLRPLLTIFGTYLFNDSFEKALQPSLAVEIFHNFTLMHDDIMDNAPLRRNKQTVHEKWNQNVAILSGDVMLIKAYDYLLKTEVALYPQIFASFNRCAAEVCEGQQLDVNFETRDNVSEAEYLEMIRLKTAVLLGYALELGARIGNAAEKDISLLKQAGENMGIAFQLKDDLLDVYGDQSKFGKQVGGDIVANKKTYLLIQALEKAKGAELKELKSLLAEKNLKPEEKVKKVTAIYNSLGIKEDTEQLIEKYIKKAMDELLSVDCSFYRKNQLKAYFLKLAERES